MQLVWWAIKEKRNCQIRKEKKEKQTRTKGLVVLAGLEVTEIGVIRPGEATMKAETPKKIEIGVKKLGEAATARKGGGASLSLSASLLLLIFLLMLAFLASRQAFFWLLINVSCTSSLFSIFYSFFEDFLLCLCYF